MNRPHYTIVKIIPRLTLFDLPALVIIKLESKKPSGNFTGKPYLINNCSVFRRLSYT